MTFMRYVVAVVIGVQWIAAQTLAVDPQPITDCQAGVGRATLRWSGPEGRLVQVRVNSATGPATTGLEAPNASMMTGYWVADGTRFFLVSASGDELAQVTARVVCGVGRSVVRSVPGGDQYMPLQVGNQWVYRFNSRSVTGAYQTWRVDRTEVIGGTTYFAVPVEGPSGSGTTMLLRTDTAGRVYVWSEGREALWLDPMAPADPSAQLRVTGRLPSTSTSIGVFDDAISYEKPGFIMETGTFVRGVGLTSQASVLMSGSSGGFVSGLELVEARLAGGVVALEGPRSSLELGVESQILDVTGRKVTNCAVPCYFVACSFGPFTDPPGTYRPCIAARIRIVGRAEALTVSLRDSSGREWYSSAVPIAAGATDQVRYRRIPLYLSDNKPLIPGVYELRSELDNGAHTAAVKLEVR
jgi:hypothetical protein